MIAGLESVTEGEVLLDGEAITNEKPRERDLVMVFQNYALYPHLTAGGNIGFGLKMRGEESEEAIEERGQEAAEIMGIEELLDDHPKEPSGGQQQRVALGRAIVRDSEAFLMDEPLSDLDAKLRRRCARIGRPAYKRRRNASSRRGLDVMERNLEDFASFADEQGVSLRSHMKTHKIPALAHRQVRRTGGGIVCQTLGEAEVMAHDGIDVIYLSYMIVTQPKLNRLVQVSELVESFVTTVDSPGNIDPLQDATADHDTTVSVVLEIDIGLNRVGAEPANGVEVAEYITDAPNLEFRGIMAFEAHIERLAETLEEYDRLCWEAMEGVADAVDDIEAAGISDKEVKVGSTETSKHSAKHPVVTEINPGMYLFNDVGELGRVRKDDCALTILTTVISAPTDDRMIVDAGSKTIAMDTGRDPIPKIATTSPTSTPWRNTAGSTRATQTNHFPSVTAASLLSYTSIQRSTSTIPEPGRERGLSRISGTSRPGVKSGDRAGTNTWTAST